MRQRRKDRPRSGYSVRAVPGVLAALLAAACLTAWIWPEPWLTWPAPATSRWHWLDLAVAAGLGALAAVRYTWFRRTAAWRVRRGLAAAAAAREHGVWVDRESGQAFRVGRRLWCLWLISRVSEEAVRDNEDGGVEAPLPMESYLVVPLFRSVLREDGVLLADPVAGTVRELSGGPGRLRESWRLYRSAKTGFGYVIARPEEAAEVLAQLRGSERIGVQEEP